MGVEEGGQRVHPGRVDHLGTLRLLSGAGLGDCCDPAVANDDVALTLEAGPRIERDGAADHEITGPAVARAPPIEAGDGLAHAGSPIDAGDVAPEEASPRPLRGRSPPASTS